MRIRWGTRRWWGWVGIGLPALLAGCGGPQNALAPHSHASRDIASLFWWMTGGSFIGLALISGLLVLAWVKRGHRGSPVGPDESGDPHPGEKLGWTVVVGLGVVVPIALVVALFIVSDFAVMPVTEAPAASQTKLTVDVVGHQWYWEVRYPGTAAVTANEIHIPVRTPVNLVVTTADVIHSVWVPELNRKIDTIPGQTNRILLYADRTGVYRGQCAEYCGLQHAHMSMLVFADTPAAFKAWLAHQAAPAQTTTAAAGAGERAFAASGCASCHTIRGTSASGYVGPDLTHLASRTTLAALTVPNRPDTLRDWVLHPQELKPGNQMPDLNLSAAQLASLVAYLETLK